MMFYVGGSSSQEKQENPLSDERLSDWPRGSSTNEHARREALSKALSHHADQDFEAQAGPEYEPLEHSDDLHW